MPAPSRRTRAIATASVVAAIAALSLPASSPAAAASGGAKPGPAGPVITLDRHLSITQNASGIVMTSNGTAVAAWLGSEPAKDRAVYVCVLPLGAKACKGGKQSVPAGANSIEASTAVDLQVLLVRGTPTLLWMHSTETEAKIASATVSAAGVLTAGGDIGPAPRNGDIEDAAVGPNNTIWTITDAGGLDKHITIHRGLNDPGKSLKTPWYPGHAVVAFDHSKPVIVATDCCTPSAIPYYATSKGNGYTALKKVKGTWGLGHEPGLVATSSGVRLYTGIGNAAYTEVVAKWTGSGFGKPDSVGDKNNFTPGDHDASTDKSGRVVDVETEGPQVAVDNLPNTTHASIYRFKAGGTPAGDRYRVASSPRGHAWVMWGIEDTVAGGNGIRLRIRPLLLPDLHASHTEKGKHGKATVTGPASCLPAISISVGLKGNPDKGWKVSKKTLELDNNKVGSSINGASLTPGKKYTLTGTVEFANGSARSAVHTKLSFRACPSP